MTGSNVGRDGRSAIALAAGLLYVIFGVLQAAAGAGLRGGWSETLLLGGGAIDGVVMVIIGLVLLQGHRELRAGVAEGVAFVYVGILIALFFLLVQVCQISASYLGAWTVGGDWEGYTATDTISPMLYLSPLPLMGLLAWRRSFTLTPRPGGAGNSKGLINPKGD